MRRHPNVRRPLAGMLLGLSLGGCSRWQVVVLPVPDAVAQTEAGQAIRVETRDGRVVAIKNPRVLHDTLFGVRCVECYRADASVAIPMRDIAEVQAERSAPLRTSLLTIVFVAAIVAVLLPPLFPFSSDRF